ncbi:MAG: twitching motility protein PilT [Lachnospiraceae bacterium]|nr:twitching motility protein PilT [Candidatus Equihabitans merdae]
MVHLILGNKGKGKTKVVIDNANAMIKEAKGSIVYIDQSLRHMYELNNKIRLVNIKDYGIKNKDEMIGFISGIISQNRDIEYLYMDGLLKLDDVNAEDVDYVVRKLDSICATYKIDMTVSLSLNADDLAEDLREMVQTAL